MYLAQKKHSSYGCCSHGMLLESLRLLNENYLSVNGHADNTDLLIFHAGDFGQSDLDAFEERFGIDFRRAARLIDLSNTIYWQRPSWHENDKASSD